MKTCFGKNYWTTFSREHVIRWRLKERKALAIIACCFGMLMFSSQVLAQKFMVDGSFKIEQGDVDGAMVTLKMDNRSAKKLKFNANGKFDIDLDYQHYYLFTFSKKGYITKKISINTKCPKGVAKVEMIEPFYFRVELNKNTNNIMVDTAFYNRPVGRIFYSKEFRKFDYDRDYSMAVQRKIEAYKRGDAAKKKVEAPSWLAALEDDKKTKEMEENYQEKVIPDPESRMIAMNEEKASEETDRSEKEMPLADVILNTSEKKETIDIELSTLESDKETKPSIKEPIVKEVEFEKIPEVKKAEAKNNSVAKTVSDQEFPSTIKDKKRVDGREEERVNYPNRVEFRVHLTENGLTTSYWFSRYNWGSINYYKKLPFKEIVEITREEYENATK